MTNLRKWSTTATGNATVAGGVNTINFAEGQLPSTVNNSMREQMAQIRKTYTPDEWGWVDCSATASVASQTTFKLTGNQTADYTANRRTRLKSGSTTRYGTIVSSSFTTETTITITVDSGSLSVSHTLAAVAAITADHIPANTYVTSNSLSAGLATYVASETLAGFVELSTTAEAEAGTDTARAVTPAGLLAAISGQHTIWVPAVAMISRTSNGAAAGTVETTTNKVMIKTFDFDSTAQEFVQFSIQMPKSWDEGTLIAQFLWSHAATVTNFGVAWTIEAVAFADDDALDTAFGTAILVTDTGGTTNDIYISPESAAVTVAGSPAAEEYLVFQIKRSPSDGSDTMAIDARLHGVKIHYTTNAFTDD